MLPSVAVEVAALLFCGREVCDSYFELEIFCSSEVLRAFYVILGYVIANPLIISTKL